MIYYLVWFAVAILAVIGCSGKKYRGISVFFISAIIILFSGLRFQIWTDWDMYYGLFNNFGRTSKDFEIGYRFINWIAKNILKNYNIYLCFLYASVLRLYYMELSLAQRQFTPFCLLVFMSTTLLSSGGLRQFLASSITFFSIGFIREKKINHFLVCIIIASLFHRSALVFLPAFWLDKVSIGFKKFIEIVPIGIIFGKLNIFRSIILFSTPVINRFSSISYRVRLYAYSLDNLSLFSFGFIKRTVLIMITFYVILGKEKKKLIADDKVYINIYITGYIMSLFIPGTFSRLNVYYYISESVLEAMIITNIENSKYRTAVFGMMILMNFTIWSNTLKTFYPNLFEPYKMCLF